MQTNKVHILTITGMSDAPLTLLSILETIGIEAIRGLTWQIYRLDCTGAEDIQQFCEEVNNAYETGIWISGEQLLEVMEECEQVIEGLLIGYSPEEVPSHPLRPYNELRQFPSSKVLIAIEVIDGYHYDIYLRDWKAVKRLEQSFSNAVRMDSRLYLLETEN